MSLILFKRPTSILCTWLYVCQRRIYFCQFDRCRPIRRLVLLVVHRRSHHVRQQAHVSHLKGLMARPRLQLYSISFHCLLLHYQCNNTNYTDNLLEFETPIHLWLQCIQRLFFWIKNCLPCSEWSILSAFHLIYIEISIQVHGWIISQSSRVSAHASITLNQQFGNIKSWHKWILNNFV